MEIKTPEELYARIDSVATENDFVYSENTKIHIIDSLKCSLKKIKLEKKNVIKNLNKMHHFLRGTYIYDNCNIQETI